LLRQRDHRVGIEDAVFRHGQHALITAAPEYFGKPVEQGIALLVAPGNHLPIHLRDARDIGRQFLVVELPSKTLRQLGGDHTSAGPVLPFNRYYVVRCRHLPSLRNRPKNKWFLGGARLQPRRPVITRIRALAPEGIRRFL